MVHPDLCPISRAEAQRREEVTFDMADNRRKLAIGGLAAALVGYLAVFESPSLATFLFALSVTAALFAVGLTSSRRPGFALFAVAALVATVAALSHLKLQFMNFAFHAYDIVVYLGSASTLRFLVRHFPLYVAGLLTALMAAVAAGIFIFRAEQPSANRRYAAALAVLATAAAFAIYPAGTPGPLTYFSAQAPVSVFYGSVPAAIETASRGVVFDALAQSNAPPFAAAPTCDVQGHPPHVILIHQESMFPPEYFASIEHAPELDRFFRSFDGKLHKMRVEIHGGGSWMSEFSLIAGMSSRSFGTMRSFVGPLMKGKVHDALPQALKRCGYRNALFYPMEKEFVGDGPFFESVGIDDIYDKSAQKADSYFQRDRYYYANVMKHLRARISTQSRDPQFVFVQTMSGHFPYDKPMSPNDSVIGGGEGLSPEFNEYLRRQWLAEADYDEFKSKLKRAFPHERFLIVQYGDHQPRITRTLPEVAKAANGSIGWPQLYMTYYSVDAINYEPPPLPEVDTIDIAYLGVVTLEAARLPLSPSYKERLRLLRFCNGRYFDCRYRKVILSFHRRLIDSGLISTQ